MATSASTGGCAATARSVEGVVFVSMHGRHHNKCKERVRSVEDVEEQVSVSMGGRPGNARSVQVCSLVALWQNRRLGTV